MKTKAPYLQTTLGTAFLICLLAAFYLSGIKTVKFHPDESHWIASSVVFEEFFTAQFDSPYFERSYWTVTQPPLARYVIGMGRRIGGYSWADLPGDWDFELSTDANEQKGAVPSDNLLWWARLPMALFAIISIMIGFVLIREAADQIAAIVWIALNINSSYLLLHLRHAMGESTLLLCVTIVTYLSYRILLLLETEKRIRAWKLFSWLSLLGIVVGAAGAAKLNGLSALLAGVGLAFMVIIKCKGSIFRKLLFGFFAASVVILFSLISFIGLNPYLWPAPAARTQLMVQHRLDEMENQQQRYSETKIDGLTERVWVVSDRIFQAHAAINFKRSFIINIPLFLVGLYTILKKFRDVWSKKLIYPAPMAIVLVGIAVATPPLFTPLDWARYYLLPVFFTTIVIAIGAAEVAKKLYRKLK